MKLIMRTTSWIQKTEKKKKTQLFVRVLVDEDREVEPTKDVTMFVLLSLIRGKYPELKYISTYYQIGGEKEEEVVDVDVDVEVMFRY